MRNQGNLQLELNGSSATLYVHGLCDRTSCTAMVDLCGTLPLHVRTLRLDLRAVGAMSGETTDAVRSLLTHWRTTRGGEFRLITSHLLATCAPSASVAPLSATLPVLRPASEAMTAAFL